MADNTQRQHLVEFDNSDDIQIMTCKFGDEIIKEIKTAQDILKAYIGRMKIHIMDIETAKNNCAVFKIDLIHKHFAIDMLEMADMFTTNNSQYLVKIPDE